MKGWLFDLVVAFCEDVCLLTGHAHGCWLLNSQRSPLAHLHNWALFKRWDDPQPKHQECPTCHFSRNDYIHRDDWAKDMDRYYDMGVESGRQEAAQSLPQVTTTAYTSGATNTFTFNAKQSA